MASRMSLNNGGNKNAYTTTKKILEKFESIREDNGTSLALVFVHSINTMHLGVIMNFFRGLMFALPISILLWGLIFWMIGVL